MQQETIIELHLISLRISIESVSSEGPLHLLLINERGGAGVRVRRTRELFTHLETSPLAVKDCKF